MAVKSTNQLFGDQPQSTSHFSAQAVTEPPSIQYGAQGMRGRLLRMGLPSVSHNQIGSQSVSQAFKRPK